MYLNGQRSLILQAVEFAGGGNYVGNGFFGPANCRTVCSPTDSNIFVGFRPALYVNL